jgi:diadenylate cyclase
VVVKNAKIYSAGCILPLTQNTAISSDLGTRHRAAIGMSEQTDAVVVVVSEETGGISVAINGNLQREVQTGKLREILLSNLVNDTENDSRFFKKVRGEKSDKG